jgi:hypothetical protein
LCKYQKEKAISGKLGLVIDNAVRAHLLGLQINNWLLRQIMDIFGILESSATQWWQDVNPI